MFTSLRLCPLLIISVLILSSCTSHQSGPAAAEQKEHKIPAIDSMAATRPAPQPEPRQTDSSEGDFDGDGKKEYAWVVPPKIDSTGMGCVGECDCYLRFSNPDIPPIKVENCIGGHIVNHGDLYGDGRDVIGILPDWFTSCWRGYYVYVLRDKKWIYAVDPITTHCNQWQAGTIPIEKDTTRKGYAIIRYSELDSDFRIVEKSVPLK